MWTKMNIILTFTVAALCTVPRIFCDDTLVKVQQGWLQGKVQEAVTKDFKFLSFEKIPYARAPIGSLRFKAPEEPEEWEGIRDATAQGPMCPQYNPLSDVYNAGSEDCLTCDVYTPDTSKQLPVFFFLSGFGYFFDGDVVGLYGPDFLVKNMVVVTCNYRKDALGFLNLGTKDVSGNAALKDQVAALEWVKNNIHVFGGDSNSVTIAGMSSGSSSIYHHMMSPMSTGLFHRALMMSGVPSCDPIYPENDVMEKSFDLGARIGMETEDGNEMLEFLQTVPYEKFINSSYAFAREKITNQLFKKMSTFVPVVEEDFGQERFITEDPMTSLDTAPLNKVELMIGYSNKEALIVVNEYIDYIIDLANEHQELMVPYKVLRTNPTDVYEIANSIKDHYYHNKDVSVQNIKEFVEMSSFSTMIYDTIRFAKKVSQFIDTYLFEFNSVSSRNIYGREGLKYGIEGTAHADMLAYLFPVTPLNMTIDVDSKEYTLIRQFVDRVTDFVINGNPSYNADISWPKFTPEHLDYLEFTDEITVKQDPYGEEIKFWDKIYDGILS